MWPSPFLPRADHPVILNNRMVLSDKRHPIFLKTAVDHLHIRELGIFAVEYHEGPVTGMDIRVVDVPVALHVSRAFRKIRGLVHSGVNGGLQIKFLSPLLDRAKPAPML